MVDLDKTTNIVEVEKTKESRIKFRGFASMPKERIAQTAKEGGRIRALQLGRSGYVELGRKGGRVRAAQLGHEGFVEMGRKGGLMKKEKKTSSKN